MSKPATMQVHGIVVLEAATAKERAGGILQLC